MSATSVLQDPQNVSASTTMATLVPVVTGESKVIETVAKQTSAGNVYR